MKVSRDRFDRPLEVLRISVTDRCNLRCQYCMPAELFGPGFRFLPRSEVLSFEEIRLLAGIFAGMGVRRFRITGGEPLLRRDIQVLVSQLRSISPEIDIALTTNGSRLRPLVAELSKAGLNRVNVSMDAVDPAVASRLAGREVDPGATWAAVLAARDAGLVTKVNAVIKRGLNEDQILPLAARCREAGIPLRFIEYMDVGTANDWAADKVVTGRAIHDLLHARWPLQPAPDPQPGETARRFLYRDNGSQVGFINSVSEPFCRGCNRARISAEGMLYTCLFSSTGTSLKAWLRDENLSPEAIAARLHALWGRRADRYSEERAQQSATAARKRPEMWTVGG